MRPRRRRRVGRRGGREEKEGNEFGRCQEEEQRSLSGREDRGTIQEGRRIYLLPFI
jgi:hypothetical protein